MSDLRSDETKYFHAEIAKAVSSERERCAEIADRQIMGLSNGVAINACRTIARKIRRQR